MAEVLKLEAEALERAGSRLNSVDVDAISSIFERLIDLGGSLVFCGVGKSGHIGLKLASTFSSLGLSSYQLHPVEALHGDIGRLKKNDALVFLSKSGTTEEILKLLPYIEIEKDMRIGLLGNTDSPIAAEVGVTLDCSVEKEACVNNQAPTTSSTLALAMGDAMAVLYENLVELSKEGFAANHPGGLLGKSLRVKVQHLLSSINEVPTAAESDSMKDVLLAMTKFPIGACAILDKDSTLKGIIVEGDIRRTLASENGIESKVSTVMNSKPITILPEQLAYDALKLMETKGRQIYVLPVVDGKDKFLGFIRMHDLLKEGFVTS